MRILTMTNWRVAEYNKCAEESKKERTYVLRARCVVLFLQEMEGFMAKARTYLHITNEVSAQVVEILTMDRELIR
jgi:hypothetical protein